MKRTGHRLHTGCQQLSCRSSRAAVELPAYGRDTGKAAREVDMRASPYDLSDYGYSLIAVETSAGLAEYVRCQSAIAQRAAPLRNALLDRCDLLLQAAGCG